MEKFSRSPTSDAYCRSRREQKRWNVPIQTRFPACQTIQSRPHLVGGLVRERQGHDLLVGDALGQQVGDAMRDDTRLPRAGPGQDQQRSLHVLHRLALSVGQG